MSRTLARRVGTETVGVEPFASFDGQGAPSYGAAQTVAARVVREDKLAAAADGTDIRTTLTLYVDGGESPLPEHEDRVSGAGGYLSLPGTAGNLTSTPDSAALSVTGDLDLRARAALDDYTPGTFQTFLGKFGDAGSRSYLFQLRTDGTLLLQLSADGTASVAATSSEAVSASNNERVWVRATWRQSDGRVQFFTASGSLASPSVDDFTQLGANQSIVLASIFDSAEALNVGAFNGGTLAPLAGKVYRAQVYDGIDGTLVYDADFTTQAVGTTSFIEGANGATVTVNQSGDPEAEITGVDNPFTAIVVERKGGRDLKGRLDHVRLRCREEGAA